MLNLSSEFKKYIDHDEDRVYVSDIKKIFGWYNLLVDGGFILKTETETETETEEKIVSSK